MWWRRHDVAPMQCHVSLNSWLQIQARIVDEKSGQARHSRGLGIVADPDFPSIHLKPDEKIDAI